jgi:hypothetical protein
MSGVAEFTAEFFNEASAAWRANKRHIGEGMFKYVRPRRVVMPKPVPVFVPVVKKLPPILNSLPLLRRSPRFSRA